VVAAGSVLARALLLALVAEHAGLARSVAVDARPPGGAVATTGRRMTPEQDDAILAVCFDKYFSLKN
jgi:hypothetical protein